ncbi:hypothetical protein [Neisseria animalis]|uniref:Uncharacterized protein n=1 Tax=Neisseria animalis TaxID=492 RepID=A0A5P3MPR8_NEIAN|nr:hypothetical protein [Neisseria animalis]QEY23552.1 hypothetical protein D0T90_02740 [Neisseria animalis]ROW32152.1 hypothetical protein CGZ60_06120 [Neisseria animalis]VEE09200.1 Uncharacterised protein [Neisseria animalis]
MRTDNTYMNVAEGVTVTVIAVSCIAVFLSLWIAGGSFLIAAAVTVAVMLIFGTGIGIIAAVIGMLAAWWLRARRNFLEERAQAKAAKAAKVSNTSL